MSTRLWSHLGSCVQFSPLHPTGVTEMLKTQGHLQTQERLRGLEKLSCHEVWKRPAALLLCFALKGAPEGR